MKTLKNGEDFNLADYEAELAKIRAQIDEVDRALAQGLIRRLQLADEIGQLKASTGQLEMSEARQAQILAQLAAQFPELDQVEIAAVWQILFGLSIARQLAIMNK